MTRRALCVMLMLGWMSAPVAAVPRYRLVDLGVLPGQDWSRAAAINAAGQIAGSSGAGITSHAFRWTPGAGGGPGLLEDLVPLPQGDQATASAINVDGFVVGTSNTNHAEPRAALWRDAQPIDVQNGVGGANIHGIGINATGRMCGEMTSSGSGDPSKFRAVLWEEDAGQPDRFLTTVLDVLPGGEPLGSFGVSAGMNDAGQVVGMSYLADGTGNHAVLWEADVAHTIVDLPRPVGSGGVFATAINSTGEMLGVSFAAFELDLPVRWDPDAHAVSVLGVFPGWGGHAQALNDQGTIVGLCYRGAPGGDEHRAALWRDGAVFDLTNLLDGSGAGWTVLEAGGVNDGGAIAATAMDPLGRTRAVALLPLAPPVDAPALASASGLSLSAAPNPFRGGTEFRFVLPDGSPHALDVLDAAGRRVTRLESGPTSAGPHAVRWGGRDDRGREMGAGIYFVRLTTPAGTVSRKVLLLH